MNHEYIEENEIVDLYLMNRLAPNEAADFEEHYLACSSCLERLEDAASLQAGLKQLVAEDAIKTALAQRMGVLAWLARAARSPRAGLLAAGVLVAVALPSTYLYRQLGTERERAGALASQLEAARSPQANTLFLALSPERSVAGGEPSARVRLPEPPGWIVLSLELEQPGTEAYRVSLVGSDGENLWQVEGLTPNHLDALTVSFHSSWLDAGDYELLAEGLGAAGESAGAVARGSFSFRVLPIS